MIAPNKQNLLASKKLVKTYQNGHKLLEEKRNGLIINFIQLSKKGKEMEQKMGKDLSKILSKYDKSLSLVSAEELVKLLDAVPATKLSVSQKRMSGVRVQDLHIDVKTPERSGIKVDIQDSLSGMTSYLPKLLELIQLRNTCQKLADEIQKTNRQISAIEAKTEETQGVVKWIAAVLMEKENLEKSVLINIFG